MRVACTLFVLLSLATVGGAQQSDNDQPTLTVRSTLVEVPILVKTKAGEVVFQLTGDDFLLTDNGVPQHLTLDQDTDSQPLALARFRISTGNWRSPGSLPKLADLLHDLGKEIATISL